MPRIKRTLAEADPNASAPAPVAKKASRERATGKENMSYKSKTVPELVSMLKERGLPHKGKKAELIERLEETSKTNPRLGEVTEATASHGADAVCWISTRQAVLADQEFLDRLRQCCWCCCLGLRDHLPPTRRYHRRETGHR